MVRALQDLTGPCNSVCREIREHMGNIGSIGRSRNISAITSNHNETAGRVQTTTQIDAVLSNQRIEFQPLRCIVWPYTQLLPARLSMCSWYI